MRNYRDIGKQSNFISWGGGKSQSIEGLISKPKLYIAKRTEPNKILLPQENLSNPIMTYEVY